MMQKLYVVRHAEASWDKKFQTDYERPLKQEGINDACTISNYLNAQNYIPDCIIYSAAQRTDETAQIIFKSFNNTKIKLISDKSLYDAPLDYTLEVLKKYSQYDNLLFVGHNPTITLLINKVSNANIDHVPTSGLAIINFNNSKLENISGELTDFTYPKKLNYL